ncbi:MAG: sigma-70 family RNA polymerase sigma factor [Lachnospiraceae bacterium]|nr:sigma-70 family RNA polymerase sigma factor [Lachnospiraceae bacterium]
MDDSSIVQMYWERNEEAIGKTKEKYGKYCYSIAYGILNNNEDAEESENDTYLGAWDSMPPHKPDVLKTFLGKITRNLSLNKWRDKTAIKRGAGEVGLTLDELTECIPATESIDRAIELKELGQIIDLFLRRIPENERNVFICRYWYFDSIADISKRYGYSVSKVKMMLYRTRKKLQIKLEEEGVIL